MNDKWNTFLQHRKRLIEYVTLGMLRQGKSLIDAIEATTRINFFDTRDVENLYACITSDLPLEVIASIGAHDFNGLANQETGFVPKSRQFGDGMVKTNGTVNVEKKEMSNLPQEITEEEWKEIAKIREVREGFGLDFDGDGELSNMAYGVKFDYITDCPGYVGELYILQGGNIDAAPMRFIKRDNKIVYYEEVE